MPGILASFGRSSWMIVLRAHAVDAIVVLQAEEDASLVAVGCADR